MASWAPFDFVEMLLQRIKERFLRLRNSAADVVDTVDGPIAVSTPKANHHRATARPAARRRAKGTIVDRASKVMG